MSNNQEAGVSHWTQSTRVLQAAGTRAELGDCVMGNILKQERHAIKKPNHRKKVAG